MVAVEERLKHSCSNITDLEKAKSEADEKFIFMQKLKNFIIVVCELLEVCTQHVFSPTKILSLRPYTLCSMKLNNSVFFPI